MEERIQDRPLICGFIKARNEIVREGNIYRAIANMRKFCDVIVTCDDASTDGTREFLVRNCEHTLAVPPDQQNFANELAVKQLMLEKVHQLKPWFVWWQDADEELDWEGVNLIRAFCIAELRESTGTVGWRSHYTQYWRTAEWARTDDGFDNGRFIKLWRWNPGLGFEVKPGTHHAQFPASILSQLSRVADLPFETIHWGNWGSNLKWKCIQYYGGLGGVYRHMDFENATYRYTGLPHQVPSEKPDPFSGEQKEYIKRLKNLRGLERTFTVVIPTYNRAGTLTRALSSLQQQTYDRWVALVLDDGSTDDTKEVMRGWLDSEPRVFYCRYPAHRGAVAINEIGMETACEWTEWWTRLGSDDWFEPRKLELDAQTLEHAGACYGPYQVIRKGERAEICNPPMTPQFLRECLHGQRGFLGSWANIAARTSILRVIRQKYGTFCDPRLMNMEDFHISSRLLRLTDLIWRGDMEKPDAVWIVAEDGASSNWNQTVQEDALTRAIIQQENQQ